MPEASKKNLKWIRVSGKDELPEGRVKSVTAGHLTLALIHNDGEYSALDNKCSHQGGPLGEGSIENGLLRCPWHGWDFCPKTGKASGGHDDGVPIYPVEEREDGIYIGVVDEDSHVRTITDVMVETMSNWGVTHVFGIIGHSNLGVADAIRRVCKKGNMTFIGVRHEGAAAFAASAFAKLTGKPAVCLAIAGPGATNLITGLYDAKVDRAPILALVGQVNTQVLGPGAFQEVDLAAAFAPVSDWSQTVLHSSKHAELMTLALKNAILKRDVATLIFPDEVQTLEADENAKASSPEGRMTPLTITPPKESVDNAIAAIKEAKKPVLIIGHGAHFHMSAITKLAEQLNAPVLTTFKGKGLISDEHPLACGVLGRSGTPIASWFMNESDLLIVLGASFANHTGITSKKKTVQVDFDPMTLGKFHAVDVPVWGEIGITVDILLKELKGVKKDDRAVEVKERWDIWRKEKRKREDDDRGKGVNSASVFAAMNRLIPANAVIAVDVGNNTYSFGRYFECKEQSVLMSGYLGSIGFGYPAAMGAWAAAQDRPIICVTGDGGFGQYMAELTTAVKYKMKITHILLNNNELGKISKEQKAGNWDVWSTSLHNPDFSKFAQDCGAFGIQATQKEELDNAIKEALAYDGPALVEVLTDAELI